MPGTGREPRRHWLEPKLERAAEKGLFSRDLAHRALAGAKARLIQLALSARLKSCPVTKPQSWSLFAACKTRTFTTFGFSAACEGPCSFRPSLFDHLLVVATENRADDAAEQPAAYCRRGASSPLVMRQILIDLMREPRNRQGLQPHSSRAGHHRQENPIPAKDHVFDARHHGDLKPDRGLKSSHVARMHEQGFAGSEVLDDQLAGKLEPRRTLAAYLLQQKTVAAKDARAQRLLEADPDGDLRRGAEKAVPVNHVLGTLAQLDRHNVSRHLDRKRHFAAILHGAVLGHEQAAAAGHPLERAKNPAAATHLRIDRKST